MDGFEARCGLVLALFAACMAISDLFAGKYGDDEILLTAEKGSAYQWYQAKSIKQSLVEGERDMLKALLKAGAVSEATRGAIEGLVTKLDKKSDKYDLQKTEILEGSAAVGEAKWAQEKDGKLGQLIGAKEHEARIEVLGKAGDHFDLASLFYQLALVLGAISLVLKEERPRLAFFGMLVLLGLVGAGFTTSAMIAAMA